MYAIEMRTMAKWFFSPNSLYQMKLFLSLSLSLCYILIHILWYLHMLSCCIYLYLFTTYWIIQNIKKYLDDLWSQNASTESSLLTVFTSYIVVCTWKSRYRKSSLKYISRHNYISFFDFYSYPTLINFHTSWFNNWFTST